jgi:hypothetical protein
MNGGFGPSLRERIRTEPWREACAALLARLGHREFGLAGDEPITMVEVVNSTAEPDGSSRTYWLRVPPHVNTATAAVAWTFGLSGEEYRPQVQT